MGQRSTGFQTLAWLGTNAGGRGVPADPFSGRVIGDQTTWPMPIGVSRRGQGVASAASNRKSNLSLATPSGPRFRLG